MRTGLTSRNADVLRAIAALARRTGIPPTVREIGLVCEPPIVSTSTVHVHLMHLRYGGYVQWDPMKPRTLRITDKGWETLGERQDALARGEDQRVAAYSERGGITSLYVYVVPEHEWPSRERLARSNRRAEVVAVEDRESGQILGVEVILMEQPESRLRQAS